MTDVAARTHWLAEVAVGAHLTLESAINLGSDTSLSGVWASVAQASGVSERELTRHVAARYRLSVADLSAAAATVVALVPEKVARRYTRKPLEPARFVARVKAALRRAG